MLATLGIKKEVKRGDSILPCWHWLYFLETTNKNDIANDGHAIKGNFLPPVKLSRRMYAGGKLFFYSPIKIGDELSKKSEIISINEKIGSSGKLIFVSVKHTILNKGKILLEDFQDIVYTNSFYKKSKSLNLKRNNYTPSFSAEHSTDPVILFRYSALTFNSHKS